MAHNNIDEGEAFVQGKTPENARALLAAAKEQGIDVALVRTANDGYIVPEALADVVTPAAEKPEPEKKTTPARQQTASTAKTRE
jgi:hypothetical protein